MDELDDADSKDLNQEPLQESESVRRIKEQWARLQVEEINSSLEEFDDISLNGLNQEPLQDLNQEPLQESESVRRIKEEWTRVQVEADGLKRQLLQDAGEVREGLMPHAIEHIRDTSPKRGGPVMWNNSRTLPKSRLPSLDFMKDSVSTFPYINARSSLRKNIFEGRNCEQPFNFKEKEAPQQVKLASTAFFFGSDTPTQTDITWSPPPNAQMFKLLLYEIEVDSGQGWTTLTESRLPIIRVYFTSEKIIMGRFSRTQEAEPVSVRLQVRAIEKTFLQAEEERLRGPWSETIWLTIEGSKITSNTAI